MFRRWLAHTRETCFSAALFASLLLVPASAQARRFFRARFETQTLEIEKVGEIELGAELGGLYGDGPDGSRLIVPDLAIDVGITKWLELDLDFGLNVTQVEKRPQLAGDPLWLSARINAYQWEDEKTHANFGLGVQLGPRLPSLQTAKGVGFAAVGVFGGGSKDLHLIANLGTLLDYAQDPAMTFGLDAEYELNKQWSLLANFAGAHYFWNDPDQYLIAAGALYKPLERLALTLLAIGGPFLAGDRVGAIIGVSSSLPGWGKEKGSPQAAQPD